MKRSEIFALCLAFFVLALASGCGAPETRTAEVTPVPPSPSTTTGGEVEATPQEAAMRGMTLKQYLSAVVAKQYAATQNLYIPPPQDAAGSVFFQLQREPAILYLDDKTTVFADEDQSLAIGRENGEIRVFGGMSCGRLVLSGGPSVDLLSWFPSSPLLAAAGAGDKHATVFDLRRCAGVYEPVFNATLAALAISPRGSWLAVVDTLHRLWVGPAARGPMAKAADLRYRTLALAFTPQEGLLLAVDQAGWLTVWAPLTKANVDKVRIPFGPFRSAAFDGQFLDLVPEEGSPVRWDLVEKRVVNVKARPSRFDLRNGLLRYRTFQDRLVKKVHLRPPRFSVRYSPSAKVFQVADLDGAVRYYGKKDGAPRNGEFKADDWARVDVRSDGTFVYDETGYTLADRMFQRDFMRLNCRYIEGQGFFLWWDASARPDEFNPRPGFLPERSNLLRDSDIKWVPVEESPDLI